MNELARAVQPTLAETYRGHHIEVSGQRSAWRVMLDHATRASLDVDTAQEAAAWLRRQIDSEIAEIDVSRSGEALSTSQDDVAAAPTSPGAAARHIVAAPSRIGVSRKLCFTWQLQRHPARERLELD